MTTPSAVRQTATLFAFAQRLAICKATAYSLRLKRWGCGTTLKRWRPPSVVMSTSPSNGESTISTMMATFQERCLQVGSSAGRIARQFGHATTRPRRGSVEVKLTWSRRSLTAFSEVMVSPQCGHLTADSSRYTASTRSGCVIKHLFGRNKHFLYL